MKGEVEERNKLRNEKGRVTDGDQYSGNNVQCLARNVPVSCGL
jgi:hypothetical protein